MLVLKFGGTSVKDANAIKNLETILRMRDEKTLVVVSAISGATNSLVEIIAKMETKDSSGAKSVILELKRKHIDLAKDLEVESECADYINSIFANLISIADAVNILEDVSPKTKDLVLSKGELLSSTIIFNYLRKVDLQIDFVDSRVILKTDSNFTEADPDFELTKSYASKVCESGFEKFDYLIAGGFIGSDSEGKTTTLGRGGSDYSAAIFAACLNASVLEIWTDVEGILTCDPRVVKSAKLIKEISYDEAAELAYFGAKVLHPKTIYPAVIASIPVYVKTGLNPHGSGTAIANKRNGKNSIKALAFRSGITIVNISSNRMLGAYGFLAKVFEVFKEHKTPVDLIATSEVNISLTVENSYNLDGIIDRLNVFSNVEIFSDMALIALVGEGIRDTAGIAYRFFGALKGINISMISLGASEINLSVIVDEINLKQAVNSIHDEFFSGELDKDIFEDLNNNKN